MLLSLKVDEADIKGARVNVHRGGYSNESHGINIEVHVTEYQIKNIIDQLHEYLGEQVLLAMVKDEWTP